jgi:6-phosphogluconolactonase
MIHKNIKVFSNPPETARQFAVYFINLAREKKKLNIALSGGSTPKLFFDYLSEHYPQSAIWKSMNLFWGDERCVPPDHEQSNYRMTKEHLLDNIRIPEQNIHRISGELDPENEAQRYSGLLSKTLKIKNGLPSFDLVILGLGDDGHTASIFPDQMELLHSKEVCGVARHPASGQKRITLTGNTLNNSDEVVFLVTGMNKKEKVFEILRKKGQWKNYPASHISPESGKLIWFLDDASAALL